MRQSIRRILSVLFVFTALVTAKTAPAEIKFGVLPRLSPEVLYGMFKPLAEYLAKETGEKVNIVIPADFNAFKDAVKTGKIDMGFANPYVYVQMRKDSDLRALVLAVEPKAGKRFRGVIIARQDSGINTVQALRGKRLAAVEKDSPAGYIYQMILLTKAGLDVHKDVTVLPFALKHDKVTMAVFNREADAGFIREDDLEKMKNKVDLSQIRIVAYTDYMPSWPVFVTHAIDKTKAAKIKAALLKLQADEPGSERILVASNLKGFASVSESEYDPLQHAARLAEAF